LIDFAEFVDTKAILFKPQEIHTQFGIISNIDRNLLLKFFEEVYNDEEIIFKSINIKLIDYYLALLDGLILAAKVADKYYEFKDQEKEFTLADLYRVERIHYYDNSYNMSCVPERFEDILKSFVHLDRTPAVTHLKNETTPCITNINVDVKLEISKTFAFMLTFFKLTTQFVYPVS